MNRNDLNAIDFDDPQIAAALTRAYARILTWPDPPLREEYIISLTKEQYRRCAHILREQGIMLEEIRAP